MLSLLSVAFCECALLPVARVTALIGGFFFFRCNKNCSEALGVSASLVSEMMCDGQPVIQTERKVEIRSGNISSDTLNFSFITP